MVDSFQDITKLRNQDDKKVIFEVDADTTLRDFYWKYARGLAKVDTASSETALVLYADTLDKAAKAALAKDKNFYEIQFSNKGGLVMPIIIEWSYKDGSKEIEKIPAQVWRKDEKKLVKVFFKEKEVSSIKLDPMKETADIDESNNNWPVNTTPSKFEIYKASQSARGQSSGGNPMQKEVK